MPKRKKRDFGGGNWWLPKSNECFSPDFYPELSFNELGFFEHLNWIALEQRDWLIWASHEYLVNSLEHRKLSIGSIRRYLVTLLEAGLLQRHPRQKYLVNPIMIAAWKREELKHHNEALFLMLNPGDQIDHFQRSKRSPQNTASCLESDQIDQQYNSSIDLLIREGSKRSPTGQGLLGGKGVRRPTADDIEKNRDKQLVAIRAQIEEEKNRLVEVASAIHGPEIH